MRSANWFEWEIVRGQDINQYWRTGHFDSDANVAAVRVGFSIYDDRSIYDDLLHPLRETLNPENLLQLQDPNEYASFYWPAQRSAQLPFRRSWSAPLLSSPGSHFLYPDFFDIYKQRVW